MKLDRKTYEYLLGVYLGDGNPYNKNGIRITVGKSVKEYAELIAKMLSPYDTRIVKENDKRNNSYCYRVISYDKELKNIFVKYKSSYQSGSKWSLPELKHPEELIAGVFDSDGSTRKRSRATTQSFEIVIYQKPKENLELLLPIMEDLFLYPTLRHDKSNGINTLNISHHTQVKIFNRQIPSKHPKKRKIIAQVESV